MRRTVDAGGPVRVSYVAAVFAIAAGVAMAYVPYQFDGAYFRHVYPHVRPLGLTFLVGGGLMGLSALFPAWPRALDLLGRAVFLAALGVYGWSAMLLPQLFAGLVFCLSLAVAVVLEALPFARGRSLFAGWATAVTLALGAALLALPSHVSPALRPFSLPLGGTLLALGAALWLTRLFGWWRLRVFLLAALALPAAFGAAMAGRTSWVTAALGVVFSLACLLAARPLRTSLSSVPWTLFRDMVLPTIAPLLALGGVASYLAERALDADVRARHQQVAEVEAAWLEAYFGGAERALLSVSTSPGLAERMASRDAHALGPLLDELRARNGVFESVWAEDGQGNAWAGRRSSRREPLPRTMRSGRAFLSRAYAGEAGEPWLDVAVPVGAPEAPAGFLVGSLSLQRLAAVASGSGARLRVVDRRDGALIRDTGGEPTLSPLPLGPELQEAVTSFEPMVLETFDRRDRRILAGVAPVGDGPFAVLATLDVAVAYGPVTRLSATVVGLMALAVALSLLLSGFIGRTVARRFRELRSSLEHNREELARMDGELRASLKVRDDFLSVASHELRTPLTPLKALVQSTLRQLESGGGDRARLFRALSLMDRQADRLSGLVGELLDATRIQAGRFPLRRDETDLITVVEEVADRFRAQLGPEGDRLQLSSPVRPLHGIWDAGRLDQVLTNLLENAIRYTPEGQPIIVGVEERSDAVELWVKDEGIGIPPEGLERVFEPFYRGENAAAHHRAGLGLGLFICREIVERHGGRIWAESAGPRGGSLFRVWLPRTCGPVQAAGAVAAA